MNDWKYTVYDDKVLDIDEFVELMKTIMPKMNKKEAKELYE